MNEDVEANQKEEIIGEIPKHNLVVLSLVSAFVYFVLAWLIYHFIYEKPLSAAFEYDFSFVFQLATGTISGGVAAAVIGFLANHPPVKDILYDFHLVRMISKLKLDNFDRFQLSLFAGVGEELLFRGAIQPWLGIWLTSVIFVGIHGYFKFEKTGHIVFGLMMFGLSMMLGYLYEYAGLIAAMTAHAVYDLIMLYLVSNKRL